MLHEWSQGLIYPLHKKNYLLQSENYRGKILLITANKMLANILFWTITDTHYP